MEKIAMKYSWFLIGGHAFPISLPGLRQFITPLFINTSTPLFA
jgi:hypothetical protein